MLFCFCRWLVKIRKQTKQTEKRNNNKKQNTPNINKHTKSKTITTQHHTTKSSNNTTKAHITQNNMFLKANTKHDCVGLLCWFCRWLYFYTSKQRTQNKQQATTTKHITQQKATKAHTKKRIKQQPNTQINDCVVLLLCFFCHLLVDRKTSKQINHNSNKTITTYITHKTTTTPQKNKQTL